MVRAVCHPVDGITRAASEAKRILYEEFGIDPDTPHPCVVMATPPLDAMPEHRLVTITILAKERGR